MTNWFDKYIVPIVMVAGLVGYIIYRIVSH